MAVVPSPHSPRPAEAVPVPARLDRPGPLVPAEPLAVAAPQQVAHEILDVVPAIIRAIRTEMRAQRQHDLSVPQFRTLSYLSRHPGSSLTAAAEAIGLTPPTMSVLVEGLVQRGLIERMVDVRDRRRVLLTLTEAGRGLYDRALAGSEQWIAGLLAPVAADDRVAIARALEVLGPLFSSR